MDLSLNTFLNVPEKDSKKQQSGKLKVMTEREKDNSLVKRVQKGDKVAFELLFTKYQRRVSRLVSRFIRSDAEAEDVVQESFIKAYRALANFRGDSAFYTWLYRIGINTAKNHLVALGKRPKAMDSNEIEEMENYESMSELRVSETPESTMMSNQIAETVNGAIQNLPDELREAISLREIDGLCYEEISELMDCPIGTVRSRIFRARETIAEKLKPLIETSNKRW